MGCHSPVGQLAVIVEKFKEWTDPAAELPAAFVTDVRASFGALADRPGMVP
ncbi:hypothetical protein ACFY8C_32170 [Streptomyces flavochromogenes]|jgi:hypothetical protein|uniref:Uncharacterized protein n=1 Tax=Streptomyces flavochromogenes TaxID=68199 RepID=A0ABW6XZK6_9ACTN|nr:hypothetical protein [Streptomyces flavochromogenes]